MESVVSGLLSDFENGRMSRRDLVTRLTVAAAVSAAGVPKLAQAAAPASPFKAISVNHISYNVADYAKSRDFYSELLGMTVSKDNGKQALLSFGDSILVVRNARTPEAKGTIDHMAYAIANWDEAKVKAELERRGHTPRKDNKSWHIKDPDGFDIQIEADDAAEQR
jgi:catechol 2,3-dioxygenase-like lactoylglutathione lyase family enzyme